MVVAGTDCKQGSESHIIIKFMSHRLDFDREMNARRQHSLSDEFVVLPTATCDDSSLAPRFGVQAAKRNYGSFGFIMAEADTRYRGSIQ